MAKQYETEEMNATEELTSMTIPVWMKKKCKKKGIPYKRCFLVGFNKLISGEIDQISQNNKTIDKLQGLLTTLSLRTHALEGQIKHLGGEIVK